MHKPLRIVIAEDETLVIEMIAGLVDELGHTVVGTARSGIQAIEVTRDLHPDVVLMDIKMPDMDGIEAAQRIAESCPVPVVVLTAFETPEMVARASAAGVGAYLTKPPRAREVDRAISIAVARFEDLMALRRTNAELEQALVTVKRLRGVLPICAGCKRIRDDQGDWQHVERYIRDHAEVDFTHGLCPECVAQFYPDYRKKPS
jgi:AmiR/NasT family two-component response regulator